MKLQSFTDKTAIGLSAVCILHCLALPLFIILFPSIALMALNDEAFHQGILYVILPLSTIALAIGFNHHRNYSVLIISLTGLVILVSTGFIDHKLLGHYGEVILTVVGSAIIAFGHFRNSRLRKLIKNTQN